MITVNDVSMNFSGQTLFKHVDLKFTPGNCYGIIGANGAGKSTFLRILSGDLEPTSGEVIIPKEERMSILKQDHFQYDQYTVLDTVIMGNQRLYDIMKEKDSLYEKEDFTDEDGVKASELEAEFADMDGWEAESDASRLIQGLGLSNDILYSEMSTLTAKEKVKVLLAQALFGKPDIILLDEPTNHLDIQAIEWLEDFLLDCEALTLVVSHDRHFLNTVCTNIVDVDYGQIKMYVGNYEFWYESSQLVQRMIKDQNRKNEEKIRELQNFIQRFSANKSKSKQATARRKLLDKLTVEEMPASSRRYPFVGFKMDREPGKEILAVEGLTRVLPGESGREDRFRGGGRDRQDHPLQDHHGGTGAGRGQLQVGHHHHHQLLPPGQLRLLQRLRPEPAGLAGPVYGGQRGGEHGVLQAVFPGADAVLRRRRV